MNRIRTSIATAIAIAIGTPACGKTTRDAADAAEAKPDPVPGATLPPIAPRTLGIEQLELDGYRACVRASNGGIYCWGQCRWDCGEATLRSTPEAHLVRGVTGASDLVIGLGFGCAIDGAREVICWGTSVDGTYGRVSEKEVVAGRVAGVKDARRLGTIGRGVCALDGDGVVTCWGEGPRRTDSPADRAAAAKPRAVAGVKLASLERTHGALCGKSRAGAGWLCIGSAASETDPWAWAAKPVDPPPALGADGCGCAIDAEHRLHCEANALPGPRLANGSSPPARALPCSIAEVKDVIAASANGQRACAVHSNGTVSCWGDLFFDGDASLSSLRPTKVAGITNATTIGFAARRACTLGKDKTVWCWRESLNPALAKPKAAFAPDFEWDTD